MQQKLTRHAEIPMTMQHGTALTANMADAPGKVVDLALKRQGKWQIDSGK
jgi:hypothetical protein